MLAYQETERIKKLNRITMKWIRIDFVLALAMTATGIFVAMNHGTAANLAGDARSNQSAVLILHASLRRGVTPNKGSSIIYQIINLPEVAYTEFTPSMGITVGVKTASDVALVESMLRSYSQISQMYISDGPVKNTPGQVLGSRAPQVTQRDRTVFTPVPLENWTSIVACGSSGYQAACVYSLIRPPRTGCRGPFCGQGRQW